MKKFVKQLPVALMLCLLPAGAYAQETTGSTQPVSPQPLDGQIVLQDMNTMLASSLIGSSVYSTSDAWVGDINDLIVDPSGKLTGVVIGVGGFAGFSEKAVAFAIDKIKLVPTADRDAAKVTLNATAEQLEAAPGFKTASAQLFEKQQEQTMLQQNNQLQPPVQPQQSQPQ